MSLPSGAPPAPLRDVTSLSELTGSTEVLTL
jgi:hypothetical protein